MKSEAIVRLLPVVFQGVATPNSPLLGILGAMETLHAPSEEILRTVAEVADPRSAPEHFLPYLSRWANLDWLFEPMLEDWKRDTRQPVPFPPGVGAMRELIALGYLLNRESGTSAGLRFFLATATGVSGFSIEENPLRDDGSPAPFHVRVLAPAAALPYRAIVDRIIQFEKPAHISYELEFSKE